MWSRANSWISLSLHHADNDGLLWRGNEVIHAKHCTGLTAVLFLSLLLLPTPVPPLPGSLPWSLLPHKLEGSFLRAHSPFFYDFLCDFSVLVSACVHFQPWGVRGGGLALSLHLRKNHCQHWSRTSMVSKAFPPWLFPSEPKCHPARCTGSLLLHHRSGPWGLEGAVPGPGHVTKQLVVWGLPA